MTSRTKLWALSAGALALSLALAGCGGGGGGGSTGSGGPTPPSDMMTTPSTGSPVSLAGLAGAMPTAGEYVIPAGGEPADAGDVTFTCPAGDADCTVTVAADGSATSAGGMATAARSAAYIAAATAAAGTKEEAIAAEAAQGADGSPSDELHAHAGLGGTVATTGEAVDTYTLAISRDRDGTTVAITDTGNPAGATPPNPQFVQMMDFEDGRTMHVRDNGEGEHEVVIVYTDIGAPEATAFAMVEGQELNARDLDLDVDADDDGTATNDYTALNVVTGNFARIMSSGFSSSGSGTLNYAIDDTNTENMDEAFETAGTYNGAPGTYRCNGTSECSVTYNAMGAITAVSGDWVFTPNAGATSDVADADYLHYGFWLKRTTGDDGTTYNEVETFAGSSINPSGGVGEVEGTATYDGGAVGVYVMNRAYDPGTGVIADATSGHFQADASLTANFGGTGIPEDDHNTITGTIDNFVLQHGEENEWSVALEGDIHPNGGTASGTAKGGVMGQDGSFSADFHGSVEAVDHDMDSTTDDIVPHPSSVVGEFNASFSNGSVAGAFGARNE